VDHVVPLACGGTDDASNMQWLTTEANRSKGDLGCGR
jgi:5-methylcytosine-specific restriction endonuclease McrA